MAKRVLKVFLILFAAVLLLLIILPFAFQGAIVERIKHEVNEQVDAHVDFGRFRLSFLRSFPDASLRVDDILVVNETPFAGDTLATIGRLAVTIDLRSLFGDGGYEIKSIRLQSPDIRLRQLADGSANWDIVPVTETVEEPAEDDAPLDFQLALRNVTIRDGRIKYHDDAVLTYVDVIGLNGRFQGDLTMDVTSISTRDTRIESFSLRYDRFPVLSDIGVFLTAEMEMDMREWIFTFRENELLLNALPLHFDGVISIPDGGGTLMDFSFAAARSDFAAFLSLVPAMYTDDFANLETDGLLALEGRVDGLLKGESIPSFDASVRVADGMFRYPQLPSAVSEVNLEIYLANDGNTADDIIVDIPVLGVRFGDYPLDARFLLRNAVSDPFVDLAVDTRIDLNDLGNFFPLPDGMELGGILEAALEAHGNMSAIESGTYQDFHAGGDMQLNDFFLETALLPERLDISRAHTVFSPQHLAIQTLHAQLGDSDLSVSGRVDNILPFLLSGESLRGNMSVQSRYLDINKLMPDPVQEKTADGPAQLTVISVPPNLEFGLQTRFQHVVFGEMDIRDLQGRMRVSDQRLLMDQVSMDLMEGRLGLNGTYDTRAELPDISLSLNFMRFDLPTTFNAFNTVQVLAPVGEYASGRISGGLTLRARLDEQMMPVLESLSGSGNIRSSEIIVANHPALLRLSERIQLDMFTEMDIRNIAIRFAFADGKVETEPFDIAFGQSSARVSGTTWFDQRIDYAMRLDIPFDHFGSRAMGVLDNLVAQAAERGIDADPGERVRVDVLIGGTVTDPEITLGMPGVLDAVTDRIRDEIDRIIREAEERIRGEVDRARDRVEEDVRERIDDTRERVQEELDARAEQLIAEAERRAAAIRREAASAAERIRAEANRQAERLMEEASGPIAEAAAKRAGDAIIAEADRRGSQLIEEADTRAQNIVDEAHQQAERIRQGEE